MIKKHFILFITAVLLSVSASAKSRFNVPELKNPVMDLADVIDEKTEAQLNTYIQQVYSQTDVQIAVLTIRSLGNYPIEEVSIDVAEQWKLGKKNKDTGVLLLVAPNDRSLRIEVGYGLEGVLTDAQSDKIIRKYITPQFKENNYSQGIVNGVIKITEIATNGAEINTELKVERKESSSAGIGIFILIWAAMVVFIITTSRGMGPFGIYFILAMITGRPFQRRMPRKRFGSDDDDIFGGFGGGFNGGSHRSSGGFGGGGFKGGGGRFGGGGASGKW